LGVDVGGLGAGRFFLGVVDGVWRERNQLRDDKPQELPQFTFISAATFGGGGAGAFFFLLSDIPSLDEASDDVEPLKLCPGELLFDNDRGEGSGVVECLQYLYLSMTCCTFSDRRDNGRRFPQFDCSFRTTVQRHRKW
jgi:hypothetical protein